MKRHDTIDRPLYDLGEPPAAPSGGNVTISNYNVTVNSVESRNYAYDDNGNCMGYTCSSGPPVTYEWDAENRLIAVSTAPLRQEFSYDGYGRRVKEIEKVNGVVMATNYFVWCGKKLCEERDGNNNVTRRFYEEGQYNYVGIVHQFYYTRDHLGSVREMVDNTGTVRGRYDYDPYGRRTRVSGSYDAAFGYAGYYYDTGSGLNLTLYRAYDADTGRWPNRDPLEEDGGINLYEFVKNSPISWFDSDGAAPMSCSDITQAINNNNQSGLDPDIIKCIAYRESGFNPTALNKPKHGQRPSSAEGLMGMTDGATMEAGGEPSMMGNAGYNIYYGSKYAGMMVRRYHDLTKGLDHYGTGVGTGYGKAIQDCANCLKKKGNCDKDCLEKSKGQ